MTPPNNISAAVRQRLLNRAKRDRWPFNELQNAENKGSYGAYKRTRDKDNDSWFLYRCV